MLPGGSREAPGKLPGGSREPPGKLPAGPREAPGMLLGDSREAPGMLHKFVGAGLQGQVRFSRIHDKVYRFSKCFRFHACMIKCVAFYASFMKVHSPR